VESLKPSHLLMVEEYCESVKNKTADSYMLTIARDGESPVRTIIFFQNAIEAAEAYNKYFDWGFARNYLTVTLYEPSGKINEKILKRNQAGESTFIRQDYIDIENILLNFKDKIETSVYDDLGFKIMTVFAKDSWRFDPERFLEILGIEKDIEKKFLKHE
jgi:hypothetical protein